MAALGPTPDNVIQVPTEPGMQGDDGVQSGPTSTPGKNFHNFYIEHDKRFPHYDLKGLWTKPKVLKPSTLQWNAWDGSYTSVETVETFLPRCAYYN